MAQVTVTELAKTVGASIERLLTQMKEAGLPNVSADEEVSDDEKQTLLAYLKGGLGSKSLEPRKITLKRKTISTLKSANRKTVNIEVRKKRTYVKRSEEELRAQAELENENKTRASSITESRDSEMGETDQSSPVTKPEESGTGAIKTAPKTDVSAVVADDLNVTKENQRKAIKKSKFSISENSEPLHERSKKFKVDDLSLIHI